MDSVVLKYGGSSVSDVVNIEKIAKKIIGKKKIYKNIVVVVSAMGDTTDELISMTNDLVKDPVRREMDLLLSAGEQISTALLSLSLNELGHKAIGLTGGQAGIKTTDNHGRGEIVDIDIKRIEEYLNEGYICVVTGFQGVNESGDICTLGRGGSDISAVALASKLGCDCHIYTDVDGIYTVDPRIFNRAKKIDYLSYEETLEMSHLGAEILEPRSVSMAREYGVKLYVGLNSEKESLENGTYVVEEDFITEERNISNISLVDDVLMVRMSFTSEEMMNFTDVFLKLYERDINLDMINQSSDMNNLIWISFISDIENKREIRQILEENDIDYEFKDNLSKLSMIGRGLRDKPQFISEIFRVFLQNEISFYQVITSDISISYIIDSHEKEEAVKFLADEFNLSRRERWKVSI